MQVAAAQFELFDEVPGYREVPRPATKTQKQPPLEPKAWDSDAAVKRLEESGDFRILRRLMPRQVIPRSQSPLPNLGGIVDTETMGLHHAKDEVIEIGVVAFTYGDDGEIGDVVGVYSGLRQPSSPIPAEITRLTGITDGMVAGQEIDMAALDALIEPADLVIAHNGEHEELCGIAEAGLNEI